MSKPIRLGTRKSALALWQAQWVQSLLEAQQQTTILVPIESDGDIHKTQPIYDLGIQGVFTKALDAALLENQIDIAIHSLKDVPTRLPEGIALTAVLPRGSAKDVLVLGPYHTTKLHETGTIATGSLRRKAQWLHRHPQTQVENLRGNVQTRLQKLDASDWHGAIFAQAGLQRIALDNRPHTVLDWMIPAPAQGAVGICSRSEAVELHSILKPIHCEKTHTCVNVERSFLNALEGGCTAPIGAHAVIQGESLRLQAGVFSPDGKEAVVSEWETPLKKASTFGIETAEEVFNKGGDAILEKIKNKN